MREFWGKLNVTNVEIKGEKWQKKRFKETSSKANIVRSCRLNKNFTDQNSSSKLLFQ